MSMKTIDDARVPFIDKATSNLKIRVPNNNAEVSDKVTEIFNYVKFFNSLPEDTTIIDGHTLDEWKILNEFKDFVVPNSIRYESGNRTYTDLIVRESFEFTPNFNKYNDLLSRFRNFFKKDANDGIVDLASLRINRSFEEVRHMISIKGRVRYMDTPYIPITIKEGIKCLFSDYYLNSSDEQIVKDYIAKLQLI